MKSSSLARVLPVLDSAGAPRLEAPRLDAPRPELHLVISEEIDAAPTPEPLELVQEEPVDRWQEGYEAGVAIGRAQAEAEAKEHAISLENAIAAARAQWVAEESDRIASGVVKALGAIEGEICAVAEQILAKLVAQSQRERALTQFCEAVTSLMRNGEAGVVTVHAPHDLIASLEARLGSVATLEFMPHDGAEVWVRSGPTMIEARLGAWSADCFSGE